MGQSIERVVPGYIHLPLTKPTNLNNSCPYIFHLQRLPQGVFLRAHTIARFRQGNLLKLGDYQKRDFLDKQNVHTRRAGVCLGYFRKPT